MTERGRRARWSAALALAPAAAAVFAGTTTWAATHQPGTPGTPTAPAAPQPSSSADVTALQHTLDAEAARVAALQARVAALRKQAAALGHTTGGRSAKVSGGTSRGSTTSRRSPSTRTVTRSRSATRTVSRPPAVHTVTGGS